jgi:transposase
MPRSGPRKIYRYSDEFKLTAVRLSRQPGMQVQTVATALEIHPFMLSKWRKDVKDGRLRGRPPKAPAAGPAREIAQLQALERTYAELKEEHALLIKAIRFWSARQSSRKATGSPSSRISSHSATAPRPSRSRPAVAATTSRGRGSTRGATAPPARTRSRTGN